MQVQVESLQATLGGLHHVYHESLCDGGEQGLEQLEKADQRTHEFVKSKCQAGAALQATEDADTLMETLDLQRCMLIPLASGKVLAKLQEWFSESNRNRYQYIAAQIDSTLGENEVGLLLVSERHQIQFPADIEVFYVSPPALGEFRHWLENWVAQQQTRAEQPAAEEQQDAELKEETKE